MHSIWIFTADMDDKLNIKCPHLFKHFCVDKIHVRCSLISITKLSIFVFIAQILETLLPLWMEGIFTWFTFGKISLQAWPSFLTSIFYCVNSVCQFDRNNWRETVLPYKTLNKRKSESFPVFTDGWQKNASAFCVCYAAKLPVVDISIPWSKWMKFNFSQFSNFRWIFQGLLYFFQFQQSLALFYAFLMFFCVCGTYSRAVYVCKNHNTLIEEHKTRVVFMWALPLLVDNNFLSSAGIIHTVSIERNWLNGMWVMLS